MPKTEPRKPYNLRRPRRSTPPPRTPTSLQVSQHAPEATDESATTASSSRRRGRPRKAQRPEPQPMETSEDETTPIEGRSQVQPIVLDQPTSEEQPIVFDRQPTLQFSTEHDNFQCSAGRTFTKSLSPCEDETMPKIEVKALGRLSDTQIVNSLESLLKFATQIQNILNRELDPALDELIFALSGTLNNTSPMIKTGRGKRRT